ncbi:hypothetical protein Tco_0337395 [Tanacetum coccineum]
MINAFLNEADKVAGSIILYWPVPFGKRNRLEPGYRESVRLPVPLAYTGRFHDGYGTGRTVLFETYVKSKDIDLWHIIVYVDYKPIIKNKDTGKEDIIPYEKLEETHKKMLSKNDEATMVYGVVLEKDSEASKTKKEKYKSLAPKAKKVSSDEETSCSGSDEEYEMAVRDFKKLFRRRGKFIRQPHDDKKSFRKIKEEKKGKEDQRCFKCGDLNHFISNYPKHSFNDQKAFVGGCWSDSKEEDDSKKDGICLMELDIRLKTWCQQQSV